MCFWSGEWFFLKKKKKGFVFSKISCIFASLLKKSTSLKEVLERWQSGRMRRSWKPLYWKVPGVRLPLSPLKGVCHGFTPFLFITIQKSSCLLKPLLLYFKKELGIVFAKRWPKNHAFDSLLLWKNILIAKLCIY